VFLYDVPCLNELPSSYDAYRKQQHRWSCGPMQLWRKATSAVWASNISWAQKLYLNMCARCAQRLCCRMTPLSFFFGTRLFATHIVSFVLYCTLVPIAVIAPEIRMPFWALIYVPIAITVSTTFFTPGGWKYTVAYVLYENAMCVVKLNAMLSGLFELSNAHEWCGLALYARAVAHQALRVVTTKLGNWAVNKAKSSMAKVSTAVAAVMPSAMPLQRRKIYKTELLVACLFLIAAFFAIFVHSKLMYAVFCLLQGIVFIGFGLSFCVDGHRRTTCCF